MKVPNAVSQLRTCFQVTRLAADFTIGVLHLSDDRTCCLWSLYTRDFFPTAYIQGSAQGEGARQGSFSPQTFSEDAVHAKKSVQ